MSKKIFIVCLFFSISLTGCLKKEEISIAPEENTPSVQLATSSLNQNTQIKTQDTTAPVSAQTSLTKEDEALQQKTEHGKNPNSLVKGSCDAIEEGSTCLEYIGSDWTEELMKTNCKSFGNYSTESCSSDFIGGCNIGYTSPTEMVSWYYGRGKAEIGSVSLKNLEKICNKNPKGKWITK